METNTETQETQFRSLSIEGSGWRWPRSWDIHTSVEVQESVSISLRCFEDVCSIPSHVICTKFHQCKVVCVVSLWFRITCTWFVRVIVICFGPFDSELSVPTVRVIYLWFELVSNGPLWSSIAYTNSYRCVVVSNAAFEPQLSALSFFLIHRYFFRLLSIYSHLPYIHIL